MQESFSPLTFSEKFAKITLKEDFRGRIANDSRKECDI